MSDEKLGFSVIGVCLHTYNEWPNVNQTNRDNLTIPKWIVGLLLSLEITFVAMSQLCIFTTLHCHNFPLSQLCIVTTCTTLIVVPNY